jgi:hypothetical protein
MSNFVYINPKNSLAKSGKIFTLVNKICEKISELPNYQDMRNNLELIKMCCIIVEHEIDNSKVKANLKIDKTDILYQVWSKIFHNITPNDLKILAGHITYLWENNQIRRKTIWSVIRHCVCDWAKRRLL